MKNFITRILIKFGFINEPIILPRILNAYVQDTVEFSSFLKSLDGGIADDTKVQIDVFVQKWDSNIKDLERVVNMITIDMQNVLRR